MYRVLRHTDLGRQRPHRLTHDTVIIRQAGERLEHAPRQRTHLAANRGGLDTGHDRPERDACHVVTERSRGGILVHISRLPPKKPAVNHQLNVKKNEPKHNGVHRNGT